MTTRGWAVAVSVALLLIVGSPVLRRDDVSSATITSSWPSRATRRTRSCRSCPTPHGGEYYRPLPMLVWWLLGAAGPAAARRSRRSRSRCTRPRRRCSVSLLRALGRPRRGGRAARRVLMFLAPQNLDGRATGSRPAPTLLATVLRARRADRARARPRAPSRRSLALAAYLSKESAYVLPLLALLRLLRGVPWRRRLAPRSRRSWRCSLGASWWCGARVLHGWGGSGDARAGLAGEAVPDRERARPRLHGRRRSCPRPLAFGVGHGDRRAARRSRRSRRRRDGGGAGCAPLAFAALAAAPLLAAGWAVGARYFYLPSVGLAWAVGRGARARAASPAQIALAGALAARRRRCRRCERRAATSSRTIAGSRRRGARSAAGLAAGHHVFHVDGGIKDLDLAVKEDPRWPSTPASVLVLTDVPASFAIIPPALASGGVALVAAPPLPPVGRLPLRRRAGRRAGPPGRRARRCDEVLAALPRHPLRPAASRSAAARSSPATHRRDQAAAARRRGPRRARIDGQD